MTTLADLTPEERAECVGMWCEYRPPGYYTLDELTERGPDLGDRVTRARRLTGPWEKE